MHDESGHEHHGIQPKLVMMRRFRNAWRRQLLAH
jgi:hypothetical protein